MNTLMKGNSPLGMIYNQSAENIAYDNNNSVKQKIQGMTEVLSLTKGSKINNVDNVSACVLNNNTLVISGVAYVNSTLSADDDILDLGKSFAQKFSFAYSLTDGTKPIKVIGTKLKASLNISEGNLYFSSLIVL